MTFTPEMRAVMARIWASTEEERDQLAADGNFSIRRFAARKRAMSVIPSDTFDEVRKAAEPLLLGIGETAAITDMLMAESARDRIPEHDYETLTHAWKKVFGDQKSAQSPYSANNDFLAVETPALPNKPTVSLVEPLIDVEAAQGFVDRTLRHETLFLDATVVTEGDDEADHHDAVEHPSYYTSGPRHSVCGEVIECIDVSETFSGNLAQVIQYVWRHQGKNDPVEDLRKAIWFLTREADRLELERDGRRANQASRHVSNAARDVRRATRGIRRQLRKQKSYRRRVEHFTRELRRSK